ncbi:hypothetical protein [Aquaspirillum serpens]|uniref:hypothetical protein n=1 Tax=Aquaspirillum serpens TaxID=190 RepID=UPI0012DF31C4|nr:hypothetical protein [Aquaspirillum serpens]
MKLPWLKQGLTKQHREFLLKLDGSVMNLSFNTVVSISFYPLRRKTSPFMAGISGANGKAVLGFGVVVVK